MAKFKKDILEVGLHHVGEGLFHEVTEADLRDYADSFSRMSAAGIGVPLPWEHPPLDKGWPEISDDYTKRAEATKHNAGWVRSVKVDAGKLVAELDVLDPDAAKGIQQGTVRGVSPRLYSGKWVDGRGRPWSKFVAHVALTNHPRDTRQERFRPVEFSHLKKTNAEAVDIFMADEEKKAESESRPAENDPGMPEAENPDLPGSGGKDKQQMEAILAHLNELGVALPADTDKATFYDRLLTALMTANAAKKKEAAEQPTEDNAPLQEQNSMQFSNHPLYKKLVASTRSSLTAKIKSAKITPAARDALLKRADVVQLSSSGDESATMTLTEVVDLLASTSGGLAGLTQSVAELSETARPIEGKVSDEEKAAANRMAPPPTAK